MTASASRSDVGYVYPGYGSAHGFRHTISGLSAGAHTVCVYAINIGAGTTNPSFGCRSVTVLGGNPFGSLDGVNPSSGSVLVSGWAIDPDTTAPIDVHIYVDGVWRGSTVAALSRPDVGRVYPGYGSAHGWQRTVSVGKGAHTVQVYAINVGPGSTNPLIGSRTFVVP